MFGLGGFLKQMNDTIKYNHDLLGNEKRVPFQKSTKVVRKMNLSDKRRLSETDRKKLLQMLAEANKRELKKQLVVLAVAMIGVLVLIVVLDMAFPFLNSF